MKYLVYGAGLLGKTALDYCGYWRVEYFVTTEKSDIDEYYGKKVITYEDSKKLCRDEYIYIVASTKYCVDIIGNLRKDGFENYILMYDALPSELYCRFPSYYLNGKSLRCSFTEVFAYVEIFKYRRIAVYGLDFYTQYIIAEIAYQCGGLDKIVGIIPNGKIMGDVGYYNYGTLGIQCRTLDELCNEIDCLVITKDRDEDSIFDFIEKNQHSFEIIGIYDHEYYMPVFHHNELIKYKKKYDGQRCFLIGNGPSLRAKDLEVLYEHHEICFAANMIYKIYDKTNWRPTYVCLGDAPRYEMIIEDIPLIESQIILADEYNRTSSIRSDKVDYVHMIYQNQGDNHPKFSNDITKGIYLGGSVLYDIAMQFAFYMGFKKIYLIGFDHKFVGNHPWGPGNHFVDDYVDKSRTRNVWETKMPNLELQSKQFETAKFMAEKRGIKIFNATRGGYLEVFERVDFDDIFNE